LQDWHDLLQKIVREGQTKGEIQSHVDPERISALIICLIEGASGLDRLGKKSQLLEMAKQHLDFYLERHVRVT
jgi:hypothetical protein